MLKAQNWELGDMGCPVTGSVNDFLCNLDKSHRTWPGYSSDCAGTFALTCLCFNTIEYICLVV